MTLTLDTPTDVTYISVDTEVGGSAMNGLDLVNQWCASMKARNFSKKTLVAYRRTATVFLVWCVDNRLDYQKVDHRDIGRWLDSLAIQPKSRYVYISNLAAFYAWAVLEEHLDQNPTVRVRRPRLSRNLPRPAPTLTVHDALDAAEPRVVAMIALGAYEGMRVHEIAKARVEDLLLADDPPMVRISGKGDKERLVPLHDDVLAALAVYGIPRSGWLFPSPYSGPLSPSYTGKLIAAALSGLERVTTHQLRHWFGTETYRFCRDIRVVQELMGHATPATTAIYTKFFPEDGAKAVRGLPSRKLRAVPDEAA